MLHNHAFYITICMQVIFEEKKKKLDPEWNLRLSLIFLILSSHVTKVSTTTKQKGIKIKKKNKKKIYFLFSSHKQTRFFTILIPIYSIHHQLTNQLP